ncbi:hypothetical protein NPX13_g7339 [Xylaria arbuscula]|uniref:Uncharacterized protein n=1 Tax=Xylaria arbuscula TaxID=114810 RepID=A0A9W8TKV9_9PEZI|nr:hypothetical protein NPX13_g7339 [Xylaria arbuscula]
MASDDRTERRNAVFLPLYPKSFLWPQLFGPWQVWVPTVVVWLMDFTIPLLSSLYTVVLVDGVWRWSTVQGVAWTLVALYVSLLVATVVLFIYWRHRKTGMIQTWDVRSIADIIFTLAPSNSLPQYRGLETAATRGTMRKTLEGTAERLGYWTTPEVPENRIFWGIGVPTTEEDIELEKADNKNWGCGTRQFSPCGAIGRRRSEAAMGSAFPLFALVLSRQPDDLPGGSGGGSVDHPPHCIVPPFHRPAEWFSSSLECGPSGGRVLSRRLPLLVSPFSHWARSFLGIPIPRTHIAHSGTMG